ncbi:hypothetical protein JCGZ_13784 [Jatropha curcas]|uniref:Protein IQ-DOMAIN 1 n=1 Tax=Jatropha curcas TaxID=180498 RepID=A0A067K3P1_JATCU|nr:protein IQ-DOMAIN 1 [Jatropha curcas]KDP30841.1 hypothetical protein JCGZ_13784 [Jatropha curcas]
MGITGELVRSVFSRNRSVTTTTTHESYTNNARSYGGGDKRRWISVRSYLCGDEFNSVLAEEDSASVKSSEATVTQPLMEDWTSRVDSSREDVSEEKYNSTSNLFRQEDAAIIIQTAFKKFLARRRNEENKDMDSKEEDVVKAMESSPSRDSIGTSMEVQTGNSVEVLSVGEESVNVNHRMPKKATSQVLKIKEDWDDSTVSSNIIKMRIQNRLEATNRRERALAYAFAQQLRICSKRKQSRSDNMGWSWLERWMATRIPECSVESRTNKQFSAISSNHRVITAKKRFFDVAEEKESCGSNDVSLQFDSISVTATNNNEGLKTNTRNRIKPARTISRRKTAPSNHCPKEHSKVTKK